MRILRTALDAVDDGVMVIDAQRQVRLVNAACQRLLGYAAEEVIGRSLAMLVPEADRAGLDDLLDAPRREAGLAQARRRQRLRRKDGAIITAELSHAADGDEDAVVVLRPVTPQQPADGGPDPVFRTLVDGITDYAIYMLDADGTITSWNRGAERIKHYAASEVIGRHLGTFYEAADREAGEPQRNLDLARRHGTFQGEGWRVRRDGSRFWASVVIHAIAGEDGIVTGFAKVTCDVTDRRRAEQQRLDSAQQAIHQTAARLTAVVNTAVDGVMMIDSAGGILMFNPACEALFGFAADEVLGRNVKMLMPAPYSDGHDAYLENYRRTGERKIIGIGREVTGQRKDGSVFPMHLSVGEARQNGESTFVGIIHDLTARKRGEEQLARAQKMESVGQLSAGIAHDFNNLLTVILGNAEFLTEQLGDRPDLQSFARMIGQAGSRGAELTQRMLAFGRRQRLQPEAVDCNQLLTSIEHLLRRTLREDIDIRTLLDDTLQPAMVDYAQIESAVVNLALNAQDAMPQGGCLSLSTTNVILDESYRDMHPEVPPGHYVMIAVTDDGTGMPPEVQKRVFEPFFTTKDVGKGSGLGLSMVYGFIKQSDGHIAIYSEAGLGTTVRLYLPAVAHSPAISPAETPAEALLRPLRQHTVLVTEDDDFVRSYAVTCLESLGYRVLTAVDGNDALHTLTITPGIDVLFSDVVMPGGVSGYELIAQARQIKPSLKVLLTSGYALETLAARGRLPDDIMVLNKPYRRGELSKRLREVLNAAAPAD